MDEQYFDRMTKSFARWTSRRRFVAGLAGIAASGLGMARSAGAQNATATPCPTVAPPAPADQEVVAVIVQSALDLNGLVSRFQNLVAEYDNEHPDDTLFRHFDPLIPALLDDLLWISADATHANDCGQPWTQAQVDAYINTLDITANAISAGVDMGAYNGLVEAKLRSLGTPEAGSDESNDCSTPPQRKDLCTATCYQVWKVREARFLTPDQTKELIDAFNKFVECLLHFGSADVASICLAGLIDDGCLVRTACSCSGDCH